MTNPLDREVAVYCGPASGYPTNAPYHPSEPYPEYPFGTATSPEPNAAYAAVRSVFLELGLDAEHAGTAEWNPLGAVVAPGDTVVLKPNFVVSRHAEGGDLFAAITHPSVLRAVADYVHIALRGAGRIIVADSPQMDCDWRQLMEATRLEEVRAFYLSHGTVGFEILDLRDFALVNPDEVAYAGNRRAQPGDPLGEIIYDLGPRSHFTDFSRTDDFYGADFDRSETIRHHTGGAHRYGVSKTVMMADAVISIPKLKVHKKVGVTLNVKGLVGITSNKNYLIHYRLGQPSAGGDQLPDRISASDRFVVRAQRMLFDKLLARRSAFGDAGYRLARSAYRAVLRPFVRRAPEVAQFDGGNWHGNDTAWRMAADLLKIFLYGRPDGTLAERVQRKVFCIVDGIVGGENNGPLVPDARPAGCIIAGANPLAVDLVAARLMGFDFHRIGVFRLLDDPRGFDFGFSDPAQLEIGSNDAAVRAMFLHDEPLLAFRPHPGWMGAVEVSLA